MAFDAAWSAVNRDEQEEVDCSKGASKSEIFRKMPPPPHWDELAAPQRARDIFRIFLGCFVLFSNMFLRMFFFEMES